MAIYRLHKRAWDASLPASRVKRAKTTSGNKAESGNPTTRGDADQTREGKAKRKHRNSAESPGGGRKGVSSGLGVITKTRSGKVAKASQGERSADQAGPKWWETLGGDKSKGKLTL
ncbi:hypothetical protein FRC11_013051 [Ceratobasidium sp. 423]|nr:hypothetical protein FRC11_013051 [Ceratobasidium sp. 423]